MFDRFSKILAKCKNETVKTIESIDENKEYQYWIQDLRRDFIPHYGNRKKIMIDKSFYENHIYNYTILFIPMQNIKNVQ
jgi:hypothetical protein